ncbi:MAG: PEP-CTERM sorting domain-containing protein [Emcibacter sp.]|nr:PEP-CTERM sorting domain-containing protein [Emcibacter sp.]
MIKISSLKGVCIGAAAILAALSTPASAITLLYDQNVSPDVIFGTGNANGAFTVDRNAGIELGLRAKIPFVGTTNSNGDGTYSYSLAEANPRWNFDWTVNTDYDDTTGQKISDFTYLLGIDFDPGAGTDFLTFDPITTIFADHSIGDNSTINGGGTEATTPAEYQALIDANNVLQQSWRHAFFPFHPSLSYDPTISGTYDIFLTAFDGQGQTVGYTEIQVIIGQIPEPAPFALMGLSLILMGLYRRKKSK